MFSYGFLEVNQVAAGSTVDEIRNDGDQTRHKGDEQENKEKTYDEWPDFFYKLTDLTAGDAAGGEHHGTEGRRDAADHDVDNADETEMNHVHAERLGHGQQQRSCDHQRGTAFQEHAHE